MTDNKFDIKILDLFWIKHTDDPDDLCAHGNVLVKFGESIVAERDKDGWTLSATALYLLRTIEINYKPDDFASQLLPCCGHTFIADEESETVQIMGCPSGIDWTIIHTADNKVKHIAENGREAIIDKESYKELVLDFADQIEQFYKDSIPKNIPTDDFDKKGYLTFWKEWRRLRDKWKIKNSA